MKEHFKSPVYNVKSVPVEQVMANDYNPNKVAPPEMRLLELSIWEDGYTQPVVCYHDPEKDRYIIVDGFHRYSIMKTSKRIYEREKGMLPIVVIDKPIGERMASTIRHNRARCSPSSMKIAATRVFLSFSTDRAINSGSLIKKAFMNGKRFRGRKADGNMREKPLPDGVVIPQKPVFRIADRITEHGVTERIPAETGINSLPADQTALFPERQKSAV